MSGYNRGDTFHASHRILADCSELIEMDAPFSEVATRALEIGTDHLGVDHGHLTRIIPQLDHWEAVASTDDSDGPVPAGTIVDLQTTFCRRAVSDDETKAFHDIPNQGLEDDIAYESYGWECYATTPLYIEDELYGTLCFADEGSRADAFGKGEHAFIDCLAGLLEQKLIINEYETTISSNDRLIAILSRILRHNLRNDLTVVQGHLRLLAEFVDESEFDPDAAHSTIEGLISLGEKSRRLKNIANRDPTLREIDLTEMIEQLTEGISSEYPAVSFELDVPEETSLLTYPTIETSLSELIENVAVHGGQEPTGSVHVDETPESVAITIADDGPGIPDIEQNILTGEAETALDHGQGVGLWLAYWAVSSADGTIEATRTNSGTEITIELPRPHPSENDQIIDGSAGQN